MPMGKRWESALVHERRSKKTTSSLSSKDAPGAHVKGDIKNKQAHLAVLLEKVKELQEEISHLEEHQASQPTTFTKEKLANEKRQETNADPEKLANLIDLEPAIGTEHESPSIEDHLEQKLLVFRQRGADPEKLANLIDLEPAIGTEHESPSIEDHLEQKLLVFRQRGAHKWVPKKEISHQNPAWQ
eukprot:s9433_g2.t1